MGNPAVTETAQLPKASKAKSTAWFWARLAAALAIVAYVLERNGRGKILATLAAAHPAWVALAAASFFVSILLGAYQWHLLLRLQGIDFGYAASFRTYYSGMFLNNFLPGTVGGDALRIYETQKGAEGWGKAAAATFLDRLFGFFSLSLLSLGAVIVTLAQNRLEHGVVRHLLYAMGFVFIVFVTAICFLLSRHLSALMQKLIALTSLRWLEENYARFQASVAAYRARWARMGYVLAISCLVQVLRIQTHWFSAIGLGVHIPAVFFFCFIPVIALAGVIPLNVGGWGIPQSLGTFLYSLPGVLVAGGATGDAKVTAAALAFLPSVVGLVVMLGGGIYFVTGRKGK